MSDEGAQERNSSTGKADVLISSTGIHRTLILCRGIVIGAEQTRQARCWRLLGDSGELENQGFVMQSTYTL